MTVIDTFGDRDFTTGELHRALEQHLGKESSTRYDRGVVSANYAKPLQQAIKYGFIEVVDYIGLKQMAVFKRNRDGETGYYDSKDGEQ